MSQLEKIIKDSSFVIEDGIYSVAKVEGGILPTGCFMVTKDQMEITAIYRSDLDIRNVVDKKDGYVLIGIDVSIPFYSVGFIAEITRRLANEGINVLVVSTFSRDYVLVSNQHKEVSRNTLVKMGMADNSNV